jgi:F-type H+-transporting ATPase subunit a
VEQLILASEECDLTVDAVCAPSDVTELFEFRTAIFEILGFPITRTVVLIFLAAAVVIALFFFGLRKRAAQPGKFQAAMEALIGFVRDEVAVGIIGPEGIKYYPYLLALFFFILIANVLEVIPLVNFPITSRMAIPLFLALLTYVIFIAAGLKSQGFRYLGDIIWPPGVPVALKPLVGVIEAFSIFFVRPFSLAVRLFANLVAGHVMLSILLVTGLVSFMSIGEIGLIKASFGIAWWALGLAIYLFEVIVILLQAYIFTLLSAVYIETSLHPQH